MHVRIWITGAAELDAKGTFKCFQIRIVAPSNILFSSYMNYFNVLIASYQSKYQNQTVFQSFSSYFTVTKRRSFEFPLLQNSQFFLYFGNISPHDQQLGWNCTNAHDAHVWVT